ncbi:MAG: right-handed parallel beta-helix repeat-containing protein [Candidatus Micrarchaeota archaeon]|nr:right-handed parallel beta-helix repeat-containing protein [Candidatus Micrarchaeota archaeon]MBU1887001.1 right-handed parallel beta-helix repeat-containing protein [Candidatus Micrarchaeota archaeon]
MVNYSKIITVRLFGLLFLFSLSLFGLSSAVDIITCTNLSWSGVTYDVISPISGGEGLTGRCFLINQSNVTLDCHGYSFNGAGYEYGVVVNASDENGVGNITVKNCIIHDYDVTGILINDSDWNNITNNTLYQDDGQVQNYGVLINGSSGNNVTNNTAYNHTFYGFFENYSSYNNISNNTGRNNSESGFYSAYSNYSTMNQNLAYNNTLYGFYLISTNNHTLNNNIAYNHTYVGYQFVSTKQCNVTNSLSYNNTIAGFAFVSDGNSTATGNTAYGVLTGGSDFLLQSSEDGKFTNNIAYNTTAGYGVSLNGALRNNISNNSIYTSLYGIYAYSSSNLNNFTGNIIYGNNEYGVYIDSSDDLRLHNNSVYSNTYSGVYLSTVSATNVTNNNLYLNSVDGIDVVTSSSSNILYNRFYNNTFAGIAFVGSTGSNVSANNISENHYYGASFTQSSGTNTVTLNIAFNNTNSGFYFVGSVSDKVSNNTAYKNTEHGIYVLTGSTLVNVSNNIAYNNSQDGIHINQSTYCNVTSNTIYNNTDSGIQINNSNSTRVASNSLYNNSDYGLYLTTAINTNSTSDNVYLMPAGYGIGVSGGSGNQFINSIVYNMTNGYLYVSSNGDTNFTNLSLAYNATVGLVKWPTLNVTSVNTVISQNIYLDPYFVSIDSTNASTIQLSSAANITTKTNSCSDAIYRVDGFYTTRPSVADGAMEFTPSYFTCGSSMMTFTVTGFSAYTTWESSISSTNEVSSVTNPTIDISYSLSCPNNVLEVRTEAEGELLSGANLFIYINGDLISTGSTDAGVAYFSLSSGGAYLIKATKAGYNIGRIERTISLCSEEELLNLTNATIEDENTTIDIEPPLVQPPPGDLDQDTCNSNTDCSGRHYCNADTGLCIEVDIPSSVCGGAVDHEFVEYECGSSQYCLSCPSGLECISNICVVSALNGPDSVFIGDNAEIFAYTGEQPCVGCYIRIISPDGNVFTVTTDDDGSADLEALYQGDYDVALIRNGTVVRSITINAIPKGGADDQQQRGAITGADVTSAIYFISILAIIGVAIWYWRFRGRSSGNRRRS